MQKRKVFISRAIILTFVAVVLSGIILVDAAKAGKSPPLKVSLGLPGSVNYNQEFTIDIYVTNMTSTAVTINKVAVGYAVEILRVRGPYEVNIESVEVSENGGTKILHVPFRLLYGSGSVVGLSVILAHDAYTEGGVLGNAFGGIKVN